MNKPLGYQCPFCPTVATYPHNLRTHLMGREPKGHALVREEAERVIAGIQSEMPAYPGDKPVDKRGNHGGRTPAGVENTVAKFASVSTSGAGSGSGSTDSAVVDLAQTHDAWVKSDSPFQRRLRVRQALWREAQGFPIGSHRGNPLGSRLAMPDAERELWNYLTPTVGQLVRNEYSTNLAVSDRRFRKMYGYPRLFEDLLSSQPLCFNLFGPLAVDLDLATEVCRRLWPDRVDRVTAVRFEHSPGRWDPTYLNNGTAADVLFEHTVPGSGRGAIAVEVKYHEDLGGAANEVKPRYAEVFTQSGAFRATMPPAFHRPPLQQILLDHLLVLSMRAADGLDSALFVLTAPEANQPCAVVTDAYQRELDPAVSPTFAYRALEDIWSVIATTTNAPWVTAFDQRYLDPDRAAHRPVA